MKTGMRHQEYIKNLLEKRAHEQKKINPIHEKGEKLTSPSSATTLEENKLLTEYMEQVNLQKLANSMPHQKHPLFLKKFFKMKRNQQVIVYVKKDDSVHEVLGRVSTVGRDFVMLNNLTDRIWIPYTMIESANIPSGVPNFTNSHQYFLYDNELKRKLMTNFGDTVAKRDLLKQQFYEETLRTNLHSWRGLWVNVTSNQTNIIGKIESSDKKGLTIKKVFDGNEIPWAEITSILSISSFTKWKYYSKEIWNKFFNI
ncbi:hypothetical protein [Mesobacillus maritimus]|uniref:Uncharacterized protein n=1 Tax=Mesobacillus maritimus TaxID=1643336 RepID=A0ABS7K0W4_9BACI|nr:hypothetical protein [Mesobacillus maritimus]MBY0095882.1 hypothetical protein [Mesobacillus maritimus]